jgi:hypothetical protein
MRSAALQNMLFWDVNNGIARFTGLLLIFAGSCGIPSIHPIYTKDKLVTVKGLAGVWSDKPGEFTFNRKQTIDGQEKDAKVTIYKTEGDPSSVWQFREDGDKRYLLIHTDTEGNSAAFKVHVIKLGSHLIMDLFPTGLPDDGKDNGVGRILKNTERINSLRQAHLYPVHIFAKLEITSNQLQISMFDPEFLENLLKRQQIRIKHEKTEDGYILTASPEELQKFAEKYAHVEEAFLDEPAILSKKQ